MRLAGTGCAVGEDGGVEAVKDTVDDVLGGAVVDLLLARGRREDSVELVGLLAATLLTPAVLMLALLALGLLVAPFSGRRCSVRVWRPTG